MRVERDERMKKYWLLLTLAPIQLSATTDLK